MDKLLANLNDLTPEKRKALAALMKKKGIDLFTRLPIGVARRDGPLALSFAQQRLWFLAQLEPHGSAYHIPGAVRLHGQLDKPALQRAFDFLAARHASLRTRFVADAQGQPSQVIDTPTALAVEYSQALPGEDLATWVATRTAQPFDLAQGPLLRVDLRQLAADEHVLVLTVHHIIADGWSMGVLIDEFAVAYSAFVQGREPQLPALAVQYVDYARWQRDWLEAGELDRQLSYWRETLGADQPVLDLPVDFARPALPDQAGAQVRRRLPDTLGQRLQSFAREHGATTFQVLLAGFAALLQRVSGQADVRIGVPVANRNRLETEGLIGLFVNTQVMRCQINNRQGFAALVEQVRERAIAAQANQDLPFERVVEALQPERSLGQNPLFQVLFNHQRAPGDRHAQLPGLRLESVEQTETTARFDLGLDCVEAANGGVELAFTYATALFKPSSIERLVERFEKLLAEALNEPQRVLAQLPILLAAEQDQLSAWGEVPNQVPALPLVPQALAEQAQLRPAAVALVCGAQSFTYAELERGANRLAQYLLRLGVDRETLVGVALERSLELVLAPLAVLKAGGAYVPLDPAYPAERLAYMIEDAGLRWVLTDSRLDITWPQNVMPLYLDRLDLSAESVEAPQVEILPEQLAYLIYTSGSTGQPKGVAVSHGPLSQHCRAAGELYEMTEADVALHFASISFDGAVEQWLTPMLFGARLVLRGPGVISAEQSYRTLIDEQISIAYFPTSYAHQLAEWVQTQGLQKPTQLRSCTIGGEAVSRETFDLLRSGLGVRRIINGYGPTETIVTPTLWRADAEATCVTPYAPIGKAVGQRTLYVLDAELNLVPPGAAGELYIGGLGLARGYFQRPGLTAERFIPDPFGAQGGRLYRTGDRVRWLADGNLEYLGRIDQQVKLRGYRIELGEIEAALQSQAEVGEAVVVLRDKRLVGYVVSEQAENFGETLRERLKNQLPDYMVPSRIMVLARLPLSPNGKVDRRALPEPTWESQGFVAPQTPAEQSLAMIWQHLLGLSQVGIHDNFFELGGDSIVSIQVVSRARQQGWALTPKDLFQHQTLQALACVAEPITGASQIDQGPVSGEAPLTPIQAWFFEQPIEQRQHWNQSVLLKAAQPLDQVALNSALKTLMEHHDALRLSWHQHDGQWLQTHREIETANVLWSRTAKIDEITPLCDQAQASLNLENGPALRALHLTLEDGSARLLLAIHHLVIDGVSWRILLDDLQTAYSQALARKTPQLPPKTTSYQAWAQHLRTIAEQGQLQHELTYWQTTLAGQIDQFPQDGQGETGSQSLTQTFNREQTQKLLKTANVAYRTRLDDLLLSALTETLCEWSGQESVLIDLEGHGREELELTDKSTAFEADLTRTVGWFTSLYPVRLHRQKTLIETLKANKEHLRQIPNKGVGFGVLKYLAKAPELQDFSAAQITFNYLGQFDAALSSDAGDAALLQPAQESGGREFGVASGSAKALEINGQIYAGELSLSWRYDAARHSMSSVQALLSHFATRLTELLEQCLAPHVGGLTPSDVPLAGLTQQQLDALPLPRGLIDVYPLAPLQQGLLFHSVQAPEAGTYVTQLEVDIDGLDVERFRAAWQLAFDRHAILRTGFLCNEVREPLQYVLRHVPVPLRVLDWQAETDLPRRLSELATAEHRQGFELAEAPLLRLCLVRSATQRHRLIWTSHHLLLDGWSSARLMGEVLAAYSDPQTLPALRGNFADYIAWLQAQPHAAAEAFWRASVQPLSEPCLLSAAVATATVTEPQVPANAAQTLDAELTAQLNTFARQQKVTLNTLVQGAWLQLLRRYTGRTTACVGVTVAGRPSQLAGAQEWLGLFINTLPLISESVVDESVGDYLRRLQDANLALREHEQVPLYQVQQWAGRGGQALFDTLVVFENYPVDEALRQARNDGLSFGPLQQTDRTHYPLALSVHASDELHIGYSYDPVCFSAEQVMTFGRQLAQSLRQMINDGETALANLQLTDVAERAQLQAWSQAQRQFENFVAAPQRITEHALRTPQAVALRYQGDSLTYDELERRANRLAHKLIALGVGAEVLVGVALPRSFDLIVALLAVLKAGGAYVPLDPDYPAERLAYIAGDSGLKLVLGQHDFPVASGVQLLALDRLDLSAESDVAPLVEIHAEQLAYVIYTSGSTGQPKGAQLTHGNLARLFQATEADFQFAADDVWTLFHSYAFDFSVWEIFGALLHGARLVIVPYFTSRASDEFAKLLVDEGVTVLNQTPSAFRPLVNELTRKTPTTPLALRWVIFGGEALEVASLKPWFERYGDQLPRLINMYGITETTVHVTFRPITHEDLQRQGPSPIGRPLADLGLYVLDADLNPQPIGVPGELYVSGAGLARGYLNRPALNAERFIASPFAANQRLYRSGDLARRVADGSLEYLGRLDQQVKIRGFRIELGEIEARLLEHPAVREAAVVVQESAAGPRLIGYVASDLPVESIGVDLQETLRAHLHEHLPDYMVPARILALNSLPLTANGKLDRRALPAPEQIQSPSYREPQTTRGLAVAELWAEVLDVEQVGLDAHFFALGGHSLLALSLIAALRERLNMVVRLDQLLQYPRLEDFLGQIEQSVPRSSPSPLVPLNQAAVGAPQLFCVHPGGGTLFGYHPLARALEPHWQVHGLLCRSFIDTAWRDVSLAQMAADYVQALRVSQPHGPYRLLGWSLGGALVQAMASLLREQGAEVAFLGLVDSFVPEAALLAESTEHDLDDDLDSGFARYLNELLPTVAVAAVLERMQTERAQGHAEAHCIAAVVAWALAQKGASAVHIEPTEIVQGFRVMRHLSGLTGAAQTAPCDVPACVWWSSEVASVAQAAEQALVNATGTSPRVTQIIEATHADIVRQPAFLASLAMNLA